MQQYSGINFAEKMEEFSLPFQQTDSLAESKNLFEVSIVKNAVLWYNIGNTKVKVRGRYER